MSGEPEVIRRNGAVSPPAIGERIKLGVGSTEDRMLAIERTVVGMIPLLEHAAKPTGEERPSLAENEQWWNCKGCKKRLGIVNNATGELRIRHDGGRFLYRVSPGVGGKVLTSCNSCGLEAVLADER